MNTDRTFVSRVNSLCTEPNIIIALLHFCVKYHKVFFPIWCSSNRQDLTKPSCTKKDFYID